MAKKQLCTCSTFFQHTFFWTFLCRPETSSLHVVSFIFAAHFHLALVAASISHFVDRRYKIFMLFFQQKMSSLLFFLSLALDLCRPCCR